MNKNELIVDSFAGGGGASKGIEWAVGRSPDIAINHNPAAIAMHKANHPSTRHYAEDVFAVSPKQVTRGKKVGLLWLSPDCRHFSRAKGSKPVEKRIRGLAWIAVKRIREIYRWLREPAQRLRKPGGERRKDGTLCDNQNRMGPIHLAARLEALERLLAIQAEVNSEARRLGRPEVDHLNAEEESRIRELIAAKQWPDGWRGDEPHADEPYEEWHRDGSVQRTLFTIEAANV